MVDDSPYHAKINGLSPVVAADTERERKNCDESFITK
jgi:hypothetical protein